VATYQLHSQGPEVKQIQTVLAAHGLYHGPLDGDFGGGTDAAVRAFQAANGLAVDGQVGPLTWSALFGGAAIVEPAIAAQPLEYRCLALTGSFETGAAPPDCFAGIAGDFDQQGLSFGVCQWNLGKGSLQPLFAGIDRDQNGLVRQIFGTYYPEFQAMLAAGRDEQLVWAGTIQDQQSHRVVEPWCGMLKTLGRTPEFQSVQMQSAGALFNEAMGLVQAYGLRSERAAALMFDIKVQNGSIKPVVEAQIRRDFAALDPGLAGDDLEVARMRIVANRRAEASRPEYVEDVRARKLTIANGTGIVHGRSYDLAAQFGISLRPAV
jgi:putative peptidoglycan binding protein